jgi:hypothetical protein
MICGCVCFAFSEFMLAAPDLMAGQFAGTSTMCKSYSARHSFQK